MYKTFILPILVLVSISAGAQTFNSPGSYYTSSGKKVTGMLIVRAGNGVLYFKQDENARPVKVDLDTVKAVVLPPPADSLVVLTEDGKTDRKYFGQFLFATPATTFYKKFQLLSSGGGMPTGFVGETSRPHLEVKDVPMYKDGNTTQELTKKNYIDVLSTALADDAALVQKIQSKQFNFQDLDTIFDEYKQESKQYRENSMVCYKPNTYN